MAEEMRIAVMVMAIIVPNIMQRLYDEEKGK